jgi:LPS-assembly lipoprotein
MPRLAAACGLVQTAPMTRHPLRSLPRAAALAVVLLLAGCGFHLRDALLLPPDLGPLQVQSADPNGPLAQQLQQFLERAGAEIAPPDATGVASLHIVSERWGDTPISIDQYGRSQEFTLRYAVIFDLRRADGSDMVPRQAIELTRDYVSVPTNSVGTEGERDILVREVRREMVSSILRRIDAVSRMVQAAGPGTPAATP